MIGKQLVDGVAVLTLQQPQRRNALSQAMLSSLEQALAEIVRDGEARAVILRAEGPVFSSGHDLREVAGNNEAENQALFALCTRVMEAIHALPLPVIAEVHGLATAAGCQLVASCDLVVASRNASFATPGVKIGLFCTTPGVEVARAVSTKKAMEMLLTGDALSAEEAQAAGLVNRVVPPEQLHQESMALAKKIIAASRDTLARGKRAFYAQLPLDRPAAYVVAQKEMVDNAQTADAQEGMKAFLEKRPPNWKR
jgi:enoyl-CoA hydratase/carnithine racemase